VGPENKPRQSEILGTQQIEGEVGGIKIVSKVKYLGLTITNDNAQTTEKNKASIFRYLAMIKGRLRSASLEVKNVLTEAYLKSLLIYFATPLVAAGLITLDQVEAWQKE